MGSGITTVNGSGNKFATTLPCWTKLFQMMLGFISVKIPYLDNEKSLCVTERSYTLRKLAFGVPCHVRIVGVLFSLNQLFMVLYTDNPIICYVVRKGDF